MRSSNTIHGFLESPHHSVLNSLNRLHNLELKNPDLLPQQYYLSNIYFSYFKIIKI